MESTTQGKTQREQSALVPGILFCLLECTPNDLCFPSTGLVASSHVGISVPPHGVWWVQVAVIRRRTALPDADAREGP
jgi:hypothetical protein